MTIQDQYKAIFCLAMLSMWLFILQRTERPQSGQVNNLHRDQAAMECSFRLDHTQFTIRSGLS